MPTPAEERPPTERDWHTDELPPLPQRDFLIPATRWVEAPAELRSLGADLGVELVAFKRRIGRYLLWRAGPAVHADARYMAIDGGRPRRQFTFRLFPDGSGEGDGPDGTTHARFRTWKEALRDDRDPEPARQPVRRGRRRRAVRARPPVSPPAFAGARPRDRRRRHRSGTRSTSRAAPACRRSRSPSSPDTVVGLDISPEMMRVAPAGAERDVPARAAPSAPVRDRVARRGDVLVGRPLVRPGALLRRAAPRRCDPAAGSACTTTTSWGCATSRGSARGPASSSTRYPLPPRNPQVGDPRAETPPGSRSSAARCSRTRSR